jgi:APA family basic amino acid/polyamine antiporter
MVNMATLSAFVIICVLVPISRKNKDINAKFKVPFSPVIPIIAAVGSIYLLINLALAAWIRFFIWSLIGYLIYFIYSQKHSKSYK